MDTPTEQIDAPAVRPGEVVKPGEQPPKPPKTPKQKNYRVYWPIVFVIILLIAAALGGWAYFGNVRLQGVANSRDEELKHRTAEVKDLTKDLAKSKADLAALKAKNAADAEYVTITEWGVKFKPGSDLAGFMYFVATDVNQDAVYPTTSLLMKTAFAAQATAGRNGETDASTKYGNCGPGSVGILQRGKKDTQIYSTTFGQAQGAVKVGDYFYLINGPQASCSQDKTAQDLGVKQTAALKEAIKTLTAAQ